MPVHHNFFQRIPFIRISSLFVGGLVICHYFPIDHRVLAVLLTVLLSFLIFCWHNQHFLLLKFQNSFLAITVCVGGAFYESASWKTNKPVSIRKDYFLAEVCQKPAEKPKTFQTVLKLQNSNFQGEINVLAYFEKTEFDSTVTTGDQLILLGQLQKITNAGNPFEYDYQSMMAQRNIRYSVYLRKGTYLKTGDHIYNLQNWAELVRDQLVEKLALVLKTKEERSVVCALTLGYRTEIDKDTLDYFASTGAMHVLSVSGLHVALIYMILGFLLRFLKRTKKGTFLFPLVMILSLWLYAFISGFSPPVQRATIMFSFVICGESIRRPVNIYNSLTASALFLVLLNPEVIFDVGFQLSYLAIFGIVLIQPELNKLITLDNKLLKAIWSLFTVSVAAQLATFPLGVFYFNQFPNFFWLSNFLVVPVTTLIMWVTIFYFVAIPFPVIASVPGMLIQKLTGFMLYGLKVIDAHPLAVCKGLVLSFDQVCLVYSIILAVLIFYFTKRKIWLYSFLILVIAFQLSVFYENYRSVNQKVILVYNSRNTLLHLINGRTNYVISSQPEVSEIERQMVQRVVLHLKLNDPVWLKSFAPNGFSKPDIEWKGDSVFFLNSLICNSKKSGMRRSTELDIYVKQLAQNKEKITNYLISNSNTYSRSKNSKDHRYYTKNQGAFFLSLEN